MNDIELTHIALPVSNLEQSINFYSTYARMKVIHQHIDTVAGAGVARRCCRVDGHCTRK
ncbi:hypothetical protein DSM106972_063300 [Dulcicalothrix desertica PCC 7102]|uniref:Glyoxalase/fosfomycin resistance/dioxygenase domain-containing protein n=1 Tax=Dulcicalothrix desertica PCC 7102 TaxID=232991 RepID=A0A3S1ITU7_9CYAN|nr:hypothetical protein [Dulcicalothrix desertica]RUT02255.1 hypothetical protein DSM106972_063300 [Dulcicalothrix desertica PCC 7102]TWH53895.1 hypothetical protein CAL7102_01889 [Dulcicalothrix desertica PCC 7102]